MKVELTKFGERHFNRSFNGTKIFSHNTKEFEREVNDLMNTLPLNQDVMDRGITLEVNGIKLIKGYAPFCKLLVVPNFTDAKTGTMPITMENFQYLRSDYFARSENELPVLSRWLEIPRRFVPKANFLVIILYSYDQLLEEHRSKHGDQPFKLEDDTDWGVVAILAQMTDEEEPMKPITMIRNAMDKKYGGSGVEINEDLYQKSVDFWSSHGTVK